MENTIFKTEKPITIKETLIYYLNSYTDKLVTGMLDVWHFKKIQEENPNYKYRDPQSGQIVTIDQLILTNKDKVRMSVRNREYIEMLIVRAEIGDISEVWEEIIKLIPSPIGTDGKFKEDEGSATDGIGDGPKI